MPFRLYIGTLAFLALLTFSVGCGAASEEELAEARSRGAKVAEKKADDACPSIYEAKGSIYENDGRPTACETAENAEAQIGDLSARVDDLEYELEEARETADSAVSVVKELCLALETVC